MKVELQINNSTGANSRFVTWAPSSCRIRMTDPSGAPSTILPVHLTSVSAASAGAVVFRTGTSGPFKDQVIIPVPKNGATVGVFVAGKFGRPSNNLDDVQIEARIGGTLVGSVHVMVRIRKNATTLSAGERDRLVAAFAQLNNQGAGRFTDFRDMHTSISSPQAHGAPGFLPWHRAYLLDLERELQTIDPGVALPYWRFDKPAPNIFTPEFFGASDALGTVQFSPTNPLQFWTTDGVLGINRLPFFNTAAAPSLLSEAGTLALGAQFSAFRVMEGDPHGSAHVSFDGSISSIPTAARDPLFFLLHCNVDRLWAKWQRQFGRFDPALAASFDSGANPIGHNLPDTMWPWNGIIGPPRPPTAPGGTLAPSPCVSAPGPKPQVRNMLDYQGVVSSLSRLGFDYDDVRFD